MPATSQKPSPLLTADAIAAMEEVRRVHVLNARAVRNQKSLGDAVGMKELGIGDEQSEAG